MYKEVIKHDNMGHIVSFSNKNEAEIIPLNYYDQDSIIFSPNYFQIFNKCFQVETSCEIPLGSNDLKPRILIMDEGLLTSCTISSLIKQMKLFKEYESITQSPKILSFDWDEEEAFRILIKSFDIAKDYRLNIKNKLIFKSTSSFFKFNSMKFTAAILIDKNEAFLFHMIIDGDPSSRKEMGVMGGRYAGVLSHEKCAPSQYSLRIPRIRQDLT
jgi:hypothetical protein